ncbi:hypothetical protein GCM10010228_50300 [Streptomyces massasporeus]|nr:hypothetical protein GCM10010228_50300 [Streptomyces massasporeus]
MWGVESPPAPLASLSFGPQAAAPAARTRLTDAAATRRALTDGWRIGMTTSRKGASESRIMDYGSRISDRETK